MDTTSQALPLKGVSRWSFVVDRHTPATAKGDRQLLSIPLVKRTIATIRAQRLEAGAMDANAATRVTIVMA